MAAMLLACAVVFFFDLKGILTVNAVLAPIMAVSLFVLGVMSFVFRDTAVFGSGILARLCDNFIVSALIYASYNLLTAIVILAQMRQIVTKKRVALGAAVIGGAALFIIALAIWAAIGLYYGKIELGEMPFLTIVARRGDIMRILYSVVLYFSMFTTAISCGYGVLEWLRHTFRIKKLTAIVVLIAVSCPGFDTRLFQHCAKRVFHFWLSRPCADRICIGRRGADAVGKMTAYFLPNRFFFCANLASGIPST